jgi:hypothetical protein
MQVAALHMHMQVLWRTAGAMSLKELQGPVPGVESMSDGSSFSKGRRAGGAGGGELARTTWVTYCQ